MKSMFETITWQQVALVSVLLGFAFAAHRFLGTEAGEAMGFATTVVAFLAGRPRSDGGAS